MEQKFIIDKNIKKLTNILYVIIGIMMFVFYFVYNKILNPSGTEELQAIIIWSLLGIGILTGCLGTKIINLYKNSYYYVIYPDYLLYVRKKQTYKYSWNDFESADINSFPSRLPYTAVRFYLKNGKSFKISEFLDDGDVLTIKILEHIKDIAVMKNDVYAIISSQNK